MMDEWMSVAMPPPLGDDELQIWRVDLPQRDGSLEDYLHILSDDERVRADRLRAGNVRLQFVVARACLRFLLGNAAGIAPKAVPLTLTAFGKPETPGMFFNVAHSGDAVLIALSQRHPVGIDIEYLNREVEALEIAKTAFSVTEHKALASIATAAGQREAFFRCWTRKEAVLKVDGRGLSLPLNSFEVPVDEGAFEASVLVPGDERAVACRYYVSDIACGEGVAAAYAIAERKCPVRKFSLSLGMLARKG